MSDSATDQLQLECSAAEHRCEVCGGRDADTDDVGWSMCGACFRADQFNGMAYWAPLWAGLWMVVAFGFLIAAMLVLAGL